MYTVTQQHPSRIPAFASIPPSAQDPRTAPRPGSPLVCTTVYVPAHDIDGGGGGEHLMGGRKEETGLGVSSRRRYWSPAVLHSRAMPTRDVPWAGCLRTKQDRAKGARGGIRELAPSWGRRVDGSRLFQHELTLNVPASTPGGTPALLLEPPSHRCPMLRRRAVFGECGGVQRGRRRACATPRVRPWPAGGDNTRSFPRGSLMGLSSHSMRQPVTNSQARSR